MGIIHEANSSLRKQKPLDAEIFLNNGIFDQTEASLLNAKVAPYSVTRFIVKTIINSVPL